MDKKTIFKYIIVFCWFVLVPFIFFLNAENYLFSGKTIVPAINNNKISIIYSFSIIIFLAVFLFLWLQSLIKLMYYAKIKEKKFQFRKKLVQYSVFLLIVFCGLFLNNVFGKISGINIGGEHDLVLPINNY